jgi:integrase
MFSSRLVARTKKGTWYFVRRVPREYAHLDPRKIIEQAIGIRIADDPRGVRARRVAEALDQALERYWQSLATGGQNQAIAEYHAACQAAIRLHISPPLDPSQRTIEELLARIEILERDKRAANDRAASQAILDAVPMPVLSFRQCAEQYIEAHKADWSNEKHARQWPSSLEQYAYPILGNLAVAQLVGRYGTQKVKEVLNPIWYTKTTTAARVRGRIEKVIDWAKAQGFRDGDNPARWAGHLDALYPTKEKVAPTKHHAAMPYREIPEFMRKLRAIDGIAARAMEFMILTAARSNEVLQAKWLEIDREGRMWVVPKERMKMRKPHRQPLCATAMAILDGLPRNGDLIFPSEKRGKPLGHKTMQRLLQRLQIEAVPHGFRSTFRDWGGEEGDYPNELLELAIAHAVGDKVEGAYRRGNMLAKRHQLMSDWEAYCNGRR